MKEYFYSSTDGGTAKNLANRLRDILKGEIPIIVCIGTDAMIGDSLGPLCGTFIDQKHGELFVYGSLNKTVTAKEVGTMVKFLAKVHPKNKVLVIDAAIGAREDVGKIKITDAPIKPGLGADKDLPPIGDASIICVISEKSKNNLAFTTFTRLSPVFLTAKIIADAVSIYVESTKDLDEALPPIAYGV
ncbi:MAG: spore protease YyaC [Clostridia bacterium]|nr:spore protease YyaC [Clostridia bacterium]